MILKWFVLNTMQIANLLLGEGGGGRERFWLGCPKLMPSHLVFVEKHMLSNGFAKILTPSHTWNVISLF